MSDSLQSVRDFPEPWEKDYRIRCPECGNVFTAKATYTPGDPFPNYTATCPYCEYVVMESEWEVIDE